jgi:hypothetical protein
MGKEIKVNCEAADLVDYSKIMDMQGNLKTISKENLEKLKKRIIKSGITSPSFVWVDPDKKMFYIDGHQRSKAYASLEADGWYVPPIPVVYVMATSIEKAKEELLAISSQYGNFTTEGLDDFLDGLDVEEILKDIRLVDTEINFDLEDQALGGVDVGAIENKKGDVEFTEELGEEHNYLVLYFDNDVDWLQAQTLFEIKSVQSLDSKPGYRKIGVGRVLSGAKALESLRKGVVGGA